MTQSFELNHFIKENKDDIYRNIPTNAQKEEIEKHLIRNKASRAFDTEFCNKLMVFKDDLVNYFISSQNISISTAANKPQIQRSIVNQINTQDWQIMNFMVKNNKPFTYFLPKSMTSIQFKNNELSVSKNNPLVMSEHSPKNKFKI